MNTIYTATRKALTDQLNKSILEGYKCFRIKHQCQCNPHPKNPEQNIKANQRNGILIIQGDTVKSIFVRCKNCSTHQKKD